MQMKRQKQAFLIWSTFSDIRWWLNIEMVWKAMQNYFISNLIFEKCSFVVSLFAKQAFSGRNKIEGWRWGTSTADLSEVIYRRLFWCPCGCPGWSWWMGSAAHWSRLRKKLLLLAKQKSRVFLKIKHGCETVCLRFIQILIGDDWDHLFQTESEKLQNDVVDWIGELICEISADLISRKLKSQLVFKPHLATGILQFAFCKRSVVNSTIFRSKLALFLKKLSIIRVESDLKMDLISPSFTLFHVLTRSCRFGPAERQRWLHLINSISSWNPEPSCPQYLPRAATVGLIGLFMHLLNIFHPASLNHDSNQTSVSGDN